MTSAAPGSRTKVFYTEGELAAHLLGKILANQNRLVGSEVEMFLTDWDGNPITRENGQKAFRELHRGFSASSFDVSFITERMRDYSEKIVGLTIKHSDGSPFGAISLEAGHQFEFASSVCMDSAEIFKKNETALTIIRKAAVSIHHEVVFIGHLPGYAQLTEGVHRSRGQGWKAHYDERFGDESITLREVQDGAASTQVTIDAGGEKFHEFYKASLLLEPALSLYYRNSDRPYIIRRYGEHIPTQVKPLTEMWLAEDTPAAVEIIVKHLMNTEVPFLPDFTDPVNPGGYKSLPLGANRTPPNVKALMQEGKLSEQVLNNVGGFIYTWPAFRNFHQALLEIRGVDSTGEPHRVAEIAQRVVNIVYDDTARQRLLADYKHLSVEQLGNLFSAAFAIQPHFARGMRVNGRSAGGIVDDIIERSQPGPSMYRLSAVAAAEVANREPVAANYDRSALVGSVENEDLIHAEIFDSDPVAAVVEPVREELPAGEALVSRHAKNFAM